MTTKLSTENFQEQTLNVIGGPKITAIEVTDSSYNVLDDTAVSLTGGYIKITGTGFTSGCRVLINNTPASSVTFVDSTTVRAQVGAKDAGTYVVYLVNSNGGVAISVDGLTYSSTPTWSTGSTLEGQRKDVAISIQLSASGAQTYTVAVGSTLPTGLSLSSGGLLSGTITVATDTTYSFTINATDAENQDSPRTFSLTVTVAVLDPYFSSTTLLIRGIGSNNGTNSTFLDSSNNGISISRSNGTAVQGSYSPYGRAGWSNYFDGTGDYLTLPSTTAVNLTGDFTFEAWVYPTSLQGSAFGVFDARASGGTGAPWLVNLKNSSGYKNTFFEGTERSGTTTISLKTWTHIAWTRSGSALSGFVNGVRDYYNASYGTSAISPTSTSSPRIGTKDNGVSGYETQGFISNMRLINGTALYTSNFTPSTSQLTAVSNTVLLTCQSPRLADSSTNNFTITRSGDVKVHPFCPFSPTDEYIANTMGGSVYFDGSSSLVAANNTGCDFGTGEFTVDFWINPSSTVSSTQTLFVGGTSGGSLTLRFTDSLLLIDRYNSALDLSASATNQVGVWAHIAFVRQANTLRIYKNGVQANSGSTSASYNLNNATVGYGSNIGVGNYIGYMSGLRVIKGQCLYPDGTTFTPPTTAPTSTANTSLLLNFSNANMFDATRQHLIKTVNDTKISTGQSKFSGTTGGSSIYFDGTSDGLDIRPDHLHSVPYSMTEFIGSGHIGTIEAWIRPDSFVSPRSCLFSWWWNSNGWTLDFDPNGNLFFAYNSSGDTLSLSPSKITTGAWHHVAMVNTGSGIKYYLNGVLSAESNNGNVSNPLYSGGPGPFYIGVRGDGTLPFHGYMSNIRLTRGVARYTANFTPPTEPFPVQ